MKTRPLAEIEIPLLLPGARAFFAEGGLQGQLNEQHFVRTLQSYVRNKTGFVLVTGDSPHDFQGALGAAVFPDFATGDIVAMEFFFFVHPAARGMAGPRLMRAFEAEALRHGAIRCMLMHLAGPRTEKFVRFYQRSGYALIEQVFCKSIT